MAQTPRCKSSKETNSERSRLNSVASKEYFLMERRRNRVKLIAEGNRYKGVMVGRERDSRDLMEKNGREKRQDISRIPTFNGEVAQAESRDLDE
jgi:hypothetical protein